MQPRKRKVLVTERDAWLSRKLITFTTNQLLVLAKPHPQPGQVNLLSLLPRDTLLMVGDYLKPNSDVSWFTCRMCQENYTVTQEILARSWYIDINFCLPCGKIRELCTVQHRCDEDMERCIIDQYRQAKQLHRLTPTCASTIVEFMNKVRKHTNVRLKKLNERPTARRRNRTMLPMVNLELLLQHLAAV
jgi:hypothetical protein